ncbi:MAG: 2-amino-4-hydroxy-6-hydroxymethyldihydropteridine diphosphokinase [Clostridia bacterium]|nr:2-amino-4-hydroxy-6-hydroxymethyldihydropteridine diphosphokinase [Clostridia bacterium]MBQ9517156.1 2-amino-4-hydroxy-6-hydroxymethyldihydropteridine diphosphokinase [Eubacterium sp.]
MKYIIGIGTNIGDRKQNIDDAVSAFDLVPKTKVLRRSANYETEPVGYADQQDFYNACIEIESELEPNEILGVCLGIEAGFGRVREIKNGPRVIDLDLILAENEKIETANLTVPHPRYTERRFVMIPLLELFPDGTAYGIKFSHHLLGIKGQAIKEL